MTAPENVVIVGASLAGLRTAEALRDGGYDGRLTLIGDEIHAPYDRPPLSKQVLNGWVAPTETALPRTRSIGATWRLGVAARQLDRDGRRIEMADGNAISYDRLVIATGSRARPWPAPAEAALNGVHLLRTPEDASALLVDLDQQPTRVLVVGAGFTGSEVASACRNRGLAVTMVELNPAPMMTAFGRLLGEFIAERQRDAGVDLRCGVSVTQLSGDSTGRVAAAHLSDGSTTATEVVVVCLGVVKNTEWLRGAGLGAGPAGCICDASCHAMNEAGTPATEIFVCGDVARFRHPLSGSRLVSLEHWGSAIDQAKVVAANLLRPGSATNDANLPRFWSTQFGLSLKTSGLPGCADQVVIVQGSVERGHFIVGYGRAGRMVGIVAVNQARWQTFYDNQLSNGAGFPPDYRVVDPPADVTPQLAGFLGPPVTIRRCAEASAQQLTNRD